MRIILFGPPGSGKGTQAEEMEKKYQVRKISLGDILRSELANATDLGLKAKTYMEKGELVPDEIINAVVEKALAENEDFILDGYPRNLTQAEYLEEICNKLNQNIDLVIYLDVDEETVIQRLSQRRVCPKCGAPYHLINMPPKNDNLCDNCNIELIQRKDDNPEVIKQRLIVYLKQSEPIINFYKNKNKLIKINATQNKEIVFKSIEKELTNAGLFAA